MAGTGDNSTQPRPPERRKGRPVWAVYAAELTVGTLLGLGFFLLLLWVLDVSFPDATGLGELVRGGSELSHGRSRVEIARRDATPVAELSSVRRDVRERSSASVVWSVARPGGPLYDRHAVQSFKGSGATIRFDDSNELELSEKSLVVVRQPRRSASTGRRRASVLFSEGFLRARLGGTEESDLDLELVAGGGSVRPNREAEQPTEFALAVDPESSSLAVHEGTADVVWQEQTTVVPSGYMVTFDGSTPPGELQRLPSPPILVAPLDGTRFRYRAAPPRVRFAWSPVDETTEFRLQIARDPEFSSVVYESDLARTEFVHGNLEAGTYYWRVEGMHGWLPGLRGLTGRFSVVRDKQPPRLDVVFPPERTSHMHAVIRGTTEPGCRVLLGDRSVPTDADGRFEVETALEHGYNFLVVQVVDKTGNTAFANHTIFVTPQELEEGTMIRRIRIPIRVKFMLTFLILVTAVVGLITFSTASLFNEDKKAYINGLTSMVSLGTAEEARSTLAGYRDRLRLYTRLVLQAGSSEERLSDYTTKLFDEFPELVAIQVDPDDGDPASAFNSTILESIGQSRDSLLQLQAEHPVPVESIEEGTPYLRNTTIAEELPWFTMAFRVEGDAEDAMEDGALVSAVLLTERLQQLTSRFSAYEQFLVDSEGNVLAHSDPQRVARSSRVHLPEETKRVHDRFHASMTLEYELDGTPMIGGFAGVDFGTVVAGAQIPRSAAHMASKEAVGRLVLLALVLLVLAIVSGFTWAHRITKPMERLSSATRKIAAGAFDWRIRVRSSDEMGDLANSFNHMASELKERERKLQESHAQLVQSEKMAAVGQLGAGIAHEVKNPLAGILSCAQLALDEVDRDSDLAEDLALIEQEARRCRKIIDNLLKFSRPEKAEMKPLDPISVLETTVAIVRHQMGLKEIELEMNWQPETPEILGDANQLQQVFMNLMINAQQAMEGVPGKISLASGLSEDGQVELRFADDGPGIPEKIRGKLFEPFFTTKEAGKGTGLGLSVSYGIVQDHNGTIAVESEIGQGTTFVLGFPAIDPRPAQVEEVVEAV